MLDYRTGYRFQAGACGALLPNTGLPSLNSAVGAGAGGGVFAAFDPFPFFLSSIFFLFSASTALIAAECWVLSSSRFDPVFVIDPVNDVSWPGSSRSSSSGLPVIESGAVSAPFSSSLPSSFRGMTFTRSNPSPTSEMVIMTTRCLSSGINSVNTCLISPSFSECDFPSRNPG